MPLQKRKKKVTPSRRRFGINQIPVEKGWESVKYYFHNEIDKKQNAQYIKNYCKNNFTKDQCKKIFANPEYKFTIFSHYGCTAFWVNSNLPTDTDEKIPQYIKGLKKYCDGLLESGTILYKEKLLEQKQKANVIVLSPQQRLQKKINTTIMIDIDDLEDAWINGEKATIDVYALFRKYGLAGSATLPVKKVIEGWLLDYEDAYHKRCEQAVEGYSHLKRPELNHRIKVCHSILDDLERVKNATKATRKIRIKKPQTADKQVAKMKFAQGSPEYKLVSIPPVTIIGQARLYTFNSKYKILAEYVTNDPKGFIISGSTIKNFDKDLSRQTKLRKPNEFLSEILGRTQKQIDKAWNDLTTKSSTPNGRINQDTVLLRVMHK